jgi:hypothetical protein
MINIVVLLRGASERERESGVGEMLDGAKKGGKSG